LKGWLAPVAGTIGAHRFHQPPPKEHFMNYSPEQLVAVHKANLDTLFGLSQTAFEGMEKLMTLNLQVAKTSLGEVAETSQALLAVKDAQALMALQASMLQPSTEKMAAYSRHVYDILTGTSAEVTKVAEANMADGQKTMMALVDTAVQNSPAGTESAVALVKSAVAAANNAFESVQKATKQATEVAEANFQAMTNTAVKASQTAAKARKAA
jgi:phasin family protein